MKDDTSSRNNAIDRVRSLVDGDTLAIADKVNFINAKYIGLKRDEELAAALKAMVTSVTSRNTGKPDKRRIVAICGRSGAGKSTAIARHTQGIAAMQPYMDEDGVEVRPLLRFDAPSPCTPKLLALAGLEALGYPVRKNIRENEAWYLLRDMLRLHKVMFIVIDEAQHAIDVANRIQEETIGNALKQLVQMPEWPVRLVLAGVAPLATFLSRKQLYNRRTVVLFEQLNPTNDAHVIADILDKVVVSHAELIRGKDLVGDFCARLAHACDFDFGSVVQMIRAAVEIALFDGKDTVSVEHFARVYAQFSGCEPTKNVFTAKDWTSLVPFRALLREDDRLWEERIATTRKKKTLPFGVRPQ